MKWITKRYISVRHYDCDVAVTITKDGAKKATCITFYNNSEHKITSTEHLIYALTATRIYFKSADKRLGLKVYKRKPSEKSARFKIQRQLDSWMGEYDLIFDNNEGCWYIDLGKKKGDNKDDHR